MNLSKGQYVRHPKKPDWGVGEILEVISGTKVRVDFETVGEQKLDLRYVTLEPVEDAEAESLQSRRLNPSPLRKIDMDKVRSLCELFIAELKHHRTGYNDAGVAEQILVELSQLGRLRPATSRWLAKWCDTGGIFSGGMPIAQDISRAIFGRVIERE